MTTRDRIILWLAMLLAFLVGILVGDAVSGAEPGGPPQPNLYFVSAVSAHDGDTLTADIHLGFGVVLARQSVRLAGFDAWEISRTRRTVEVDDAEIERGKLAREALLALLAAGAPYLAPEGRGRDPYGRVLARLVIVTPTGGVIDAAEHMRARGHDRDYRPTAAPAP